MVSFLERRGKGGQHDNGTIFRLNKDGSGYTVLHHFAGGPSDGRYPEGNLIQASDCILYGTARSGGSANAGIIFTLNPNTTNYTIMRHFSGAAGDGNGPNAALLEGQNGALYGTTTINHGTLFKVNKDGSDFTNLHLFTGRDDDGSAPWGPLIQTSDGIFFGTTAFGGSNNLGTVFALDSDGSGFRTLYSFAGPRFADGQSPRAVPLIDAGDGSFYGTTGGGGTNGWGQYSGSKETAMATAYWLI